MATRTVGVAGTYLTLLAVGNAIRAIGTLTEDEIIELIDDSDYPTSANTDLNFATVTLGSFRIYLRPAAGVRHNGDFGNGARLQHARGGGLLQWNNLIVEDLSFENTSTGNNDGVGANTRTQFNRCIMRCGDSASININLSGGGGTIIAGMASCRVVGGITRVRVNRVQSNIQAVSCFGAATGVDFSTDQTLSGDVSDNMSYGAGVGFGGTGTWGTGTNNASQDGTHPGTSGVLLNANPFEADGFTPSVGGLLDSAGTPIAGITLDSGNKAYHATTPAIGGYATVVSGVIPPSGSAGGPYTGFKNITLNVIGSVTPGTDPNPTTLWTADKAGTFADATAHITTFTPTAKGPYVLTHTISSTDSADVVDTASLELLVSASPAFFILADNIMSPSVVAGGDYSGNWNTQIQLNATVTPGTDPSPTYLWTADLAGTFNDNTLLNPTFTPSVSGPYVLTLTVSTTDTADVIDTANLTSIAVASLVDAGGPYSGETNGTVQLNASVVAGSDPSPTILWTSSTGSFSDDAITNPIYTPVSSGAKLVSLAVTTTDSPIVNRSVNVSVGLKQPEEYFNETSYSLIGDFIVSWDNLGTLGAAADMIAVQSVSAVVQPDSNELLASITNANDGYMRGAVIDTDSGALSSTLFVVAKIPIRPSSVSYLVNNYVTLATDRSNVIQVDSGSDVLSAYTDGSTSVLLPYDPTEVLIIIVRTDGANSFFEINGQRSPISTFVAKNIMGLMLFSDQAGISNMPIGTWIGEVIRQHYSMHDNDIALVRNLLISKWQGNSLKRRNSLFTGKVFLRGTPLRVN